MHTFSPIIKLKFELNQWAQWWFNYIKPHGINSEGVFVQMATRVWHLQASPMTSTILLVNKIALFLPSLKHPYF